MWDMNEVVSVEYRCDYVCYLVFDDGVCGEVDFANFLHMGPVFCPLKEVEFFKKVAVDGGTVCWPNGADIAPENLYELLTGSEARVAEDSGGYSAGSNAVEKKGE